jgi:hypothetical protein
VCINENISNIKYFAVFPVLSRPQYVWPLTNLTYDYETKGPRAGNYNQCGFHFGGSHPSFAGAPLQLDGDKYPYIDIYIDDRSIFESFYFALFVNISGSNGCMFHYKSSKSVNDTGITNVRVCVNDSSLFLRSSTGPESLRVKMPFSSWAQGDWIMLQAGRNFVDESVAVILRKNATTDNSKKSDQLGSNRLVLPGTLRIGAKHDSTSPLPLTITCITLYDSIPQAGTVLTEMEDECKLSPSVSGE